MGHIVRTISEVGHIDWRPSRRGDTIFGAKFSIRLFRYYIKFLNKENMHTYSYGVLLYSDGRMPPLVALFADLYQFCTRYVKSNNDLCSADVLTWRVLRAIVNTSAEHRSLLLLTGRTNCRPVPSRAVRTPFRAVQSRPDTVRSRLDTVFALPIRHVRKC